MSPRTCTRLDVAFPSSGDECRAWLFLPDTEHPPLVIRDQLAGLRGKPPVMVPLVGPPGSAALMTSPDSEPGYRALIPEGAEFHNGVAARFLLHVGLHRPGQATPKIDAPILFCICDTDA